MKFLILVLGLLAGNVNALAQSLQCSQAQSTAETVICTHAILSHEYESIQAEQQRLLSSGSLSADDLSAWQRTLSLCMDVHCVDVAFDTWKELASKAGGPVHGGYTETNPIAGPAASDAQVTAFVPQSPEKTPAESGDQLPRAVPVTSSGTLPGAPPGTVDAPQSSLPSTGGGNLWIILVPMFAIGSALLGKRDRRYRTGIRENPSRRRRLTGLLLILIAFAILAKFH